MHQKLTKINAEKSISTQKSPSKVGQEITLKFDLVATGVGDGMLLCAATSLARVIEDTMNAIGNRREAREAYANWALARMHHQTPNFAERSKQHDAHLPLSFRCVCERFLRPRPRLELANWLVAILI